RSERALSAGFFSADGGVLSRLNTDSLRASSTAEKASAAGSFWGIGFFAILFTTLASALQRQGGLRELTCHATPFRADGQTGTIRCKCPASTPPNRRRRALVQSPLIHSILCKPNGFLPKG